MTQTVRRRLSPEDRRNQLLDCARHIIVNKGLSGLTMEKLVREFTSFRESVTQRTENVGSYRDAVRGYVDVNFRQFAGGDVLSVLLGQPDVRRVIDEQEKPRYAPFFIKELAKEFKIRRGLAQKIVVLASGASIAAAENYARFGGNREQQIDQTVAFIFGGIEQLLSADASD